MTHVLLGEVVVVGKWRGELEVVDVVPELREELARHLHHVVAKGGLKLINEKLETFAKLDSTVYLIFGDMANTYN